ncbi:hypothetical protein MCANUF31_02546 [Mycoplasmopsis canis UF31]|nr:hypothetical protein MCANUF31_02546 [Mycoplasmopsis canis UF31]
MFLIKLHIILMFFNTKVKGVGFFVKIKFNCKFLHEFFITHNTALKRGLLSFVGFSIIFWLIFFCLLFYYFFSSYPLNINEITKFYLKL